MDPAIEKTPVETPVDSEATSTTNFAGADVTNPNNQELRDPEKLPETEIEKPPRDVHGWRVFPDNTQAKR